MIYVFLTRIPKPKLMSRKLVVEMMCPFTAILCIEKFISDYKAVASEYIFPYAISLWTALSSLDF